MRDSCYSPNVQQAMSSNVLKATQQWSINNEQIRGQEDTTEPMEQLVTQDKACVHVAKCAPAQHETNTAKLQQEMNEDNNNGNNDQCLYLNLMELIAIKQAIATTTNYIQALEIVVVKTHQLE